MFFVPPFTISYDTFAQIRALCVNFSDFWTLWHVETSVVLHRIEGVIEIVSVSNCEHLDTADII